MTTPCNSPTPIINKRDTIISTHKHDEKIKKPIPIKIKTKTSNSKQFKVGKNPPRIICNDIQYDLEKVMLKKLSGFSQENKIKEYDLNQKEEVEQMRIEEKEIAKLETQLNGI